MTVIDWAILGILAVSALISLQRGFLKEALSLATWVVAFIVGRLFSGQLATLLAQVIDTNSLRWLLAFAILFAGTVVLGAMLNHLFSHFVEATGLTGTDRIFGMFFGLIRGVILLVALVYGLQFTAAVQDPWWQDSKLLPYLMTLADWARKTLPSTTGPIFSFQ